MTTILNFFKYQNGDTPQWRTGRDISQQESPKKGQGATMFNPVSDLAHVNAL